MSVGLASTARHQVQGEAVRIGLETLLPRTEEAIRERNSKTGPGF